MSIQTNNDHKGVMAEAVPLKADELRRTCDESLFDFHNADELPKLAGVVGQERAVEAVEFGIGMNGQGYNIYALGSVGAGRTSTIKRFVTEQAKGKPVPDDWCYVHNFKDHYKPGYLKLPPGKGREFRADMDEFILIVKKNIKQALEREDYETERNKIMQQVQKQQGELLGGLESKVKERGFVLNRGPEGFFVMPVKDGETLGPAEYGQLPDEEKKRLEEAGQELQKELQSAVRKIREIESDADRKMQDLERNTILFAIEYHVDAIKEKYRNGAITQFMDAVKKDIVSNPGNIMAPRKQKEQQQQSFMPTQQEDSKVDRYRVNLIVDNAESEGAPVVFETNPTFQNLIGKVERQAQYGMLTTNFNLIKPGALHRANGGFLILEAEALLRNPFSYQSLKRALKDKDIKIYDLSEFYSAISTTTLEPEPVPLNVKIVIIGNPKFYYLLFALDEEFNELFKVKAEFNSYMHRTAENEETYARFLALRCKEEGLCRMENSGIARVVEFGSELVGDQTKLSTRFADICDIIRQASYWTERAGDAGIKREHVQKAIDAGKYRSNRVEEVIREMIDKGDIFIDTEGEVVGQVNGLSVVTMGDYMFGRPSRVTARTSMGRNGVVNIEREVKMSGPIHNKGILILAGYINGTYGQQKPVSLDASIGFEQMYEGIEGDSASLAELYALLSSLSGIPVMQQYAVTGSVNQHGEVQPVGGVTQKVEGYFAVCKARGLNGEQGVLIPRSNVKNLMLSEEIVTASREGKFNIYPIDNIHQGIEILTGMPAGVMNADGTYPAGTVHHHVDKRLTEFAEGLKDFAKK